MVTGSDGLLRRIVRRLRGGRVTRGPLPPCQVYAMRLEAGRAVAGSLVRLSPEGDFYQPMVDPDGTQVAFWGATPGRTGRHLWLTSLDAPRARCVTPRPALHGWLRSKPW